MRNVLIGFKSNINITIRVDKQYEFSGVGVKFDWANRQMHAKVSEAHEEL